MPIYYVCDSDGNDSNIGSQIQPFKTIQAASNIAQPGDTIMVQPGIYRERVSPPRGGLSATQQITYKSVIPQKAIIRGSVQWRPQQSQQSQELPNQEKSVLKNIYSGVLDSTVFKDDSAIDGANPFLIPCAVTPYNRGGRPEWLAGDKTADPNLSYSLGQVFVDDAEMFQRPYRCEMEALPNSWWYDISENQLYVHTEVISYPPFDTESDEGTSVNAKTIEITNQRRLFAPHLRNLKYIVVDGFVMERCGNQYPNKFWVQPENQQAGMIGTRSGKYWTIQNNIIRFAAGIGVDWGNEGGLGQDLEKIQDLEKGVNGQASGSYGHVIKNNYICDNGASGTASYMGKNFVFSDNIVERNNNWFYYGKQRWESAGLKIHCPSNSIISGNTIRNNYCNGIWCDQGAGQNSVFQNNLITGNQGNGLNFEIGTGTCGKVLNNIFDKNEYNIAFITSGGCLVAHNLFISSQKGDIYTCLFNRPTDKWDSLRLEIYYNLFLNSTTYLLLSAPSPISSRFLNYNQYCVDGRFVFLPDSKTKVVKNLSEWQLTWSLTNGANMDESSIIYNDGDCVLDPFGSQLFFNCKLTPLPFISRPDIMGDYFGNLWTTDNCVAGPFVSTTGSIPLHL